MGPRRSKNGFCRTRDIPDTIISKEERSQPHNHANHMLWSWERFYMNVQNFVPDTQVDIQWVLIVPYSEWRDLTGLDSALKLTS